MKGAADPPLIRVEDLDDATEAQAKSGAGKLSQAAEAPPKMIAVETLEGSEPVRPQAEREAPVDFSIDEPSPVGRRVWHIWSVLVGGIALVLVGIAQWVLGLLANMPFLGVPASVAAIALISGLLVLGWRELTALRRLRDVRQVRAEVEGADGERLRRLLLRIGSDIGAAPVAKRAAEAVEDQGPTAARLMLSREALSPLDLRAAKAVGAAAKQGFVMVTASPSSALDAALLMLRATRLVREIATIYGYRPSTLVLRSLAFATSRDAGAVALANALTEAAADATSRSIAKAGDAIAGAGVMASASGPGLIVGIPIIAIGSAMSLVGRTIGTAGGSVGGGATAAWRLYRFGLMVLVASRPLPFNPGELNDLRRAARQELARLSISPLSGQRASPQRPT